MRLKKLCGFLLLTLNAFIAKTPLLTGALGEKKSIQIVGKRPPFRVPQSPPPPQHERESLLVLQRQLKYYQDNRSNYTNEKKRSEYSFNLKTLQEYYEDLKEDFEKTPKTLVLQKQYDYYQQCNTKLFSWFAELNERFRKYQDDGGVLRVFGGCADTIFTQIAHLYLMSHERWINLIIKKNSIEGLSYCKTCSDKDDFIKNVLSCLTIIYKEDVTWEALEFAFLRLQKMCPLYQQQISRREIAR